MKRKNMMRRNLRKSIQNSLGRYIAIVAIVVLGAGIFCGLRVTKVDMIATVQDYTDKQNMFDLRVMNTYGWTDDEVAALSRMEGISSAEGSSSLDALIHMGDHEDHAFKLLSIPETVNQVSLAAGRMPTAPNECLIDSFRYDESIIGQTIYISDANEEDTLEALAFDRYTVVGLTGTPLYLNMQRGSTSIGSGSIAAYAYIPAEGFNLDVYTQIDLTLEGDYAVYTDAFDDAMDDMAEVLEDACVPLADNRFQEVIAEPVAELQDAEAELRDAEAEIRDGEQEILDNEQELLDGEQKIRDSEQELLDGEQELAQGWQEYYDGVAEYEDGKSQALQQLAEAEQKLLDGERELEENRQLLADGQAQIAEAEQTLADNQAQIDQGWEALEQSRAEVQAQLDSARAELDENKQAVESGLAQVNDGLAQIDEALPQLEEGIAQLEDGIAQLDEAIAQLEQMLEQLPILENVLGEQLEELKAQRAEYAAMLEQYQAQYKELLQQRQELLETKAMLEDSLLAIESGYQELENAQLQAEEEFAAAEQELREGQAQLDAGRAELEAKKAELQEGLTALAQAEQELQDGWEEYDTGRAKVLQELEDGQRRLADAKQELLSGEQELQDGRIQLEDAKGELQDGRQALEEARKELEDAKAEVADGWKEVEDGWKEIQDLEDPTVYVLTRNTNLGYVVLESDSDIVAGVAKIFPAFFLAVAALVCITTMSRMVDEERTQIGVLKALGYSSGAIMSKYMGYSATAALLGCALGVLVGCTLFPTIIWNAYCIMYGFSDQLTLSYDLSTIVFLFVSYVGLMLGVTWYCCRRELKEVPAELIRPKAPSTGKKVLLEKLPIWKKLSFLNKVSIRNIFRYRQRLAMMLLGIGGCTALLVTGFGLKDSIADIATRQFETVTLYDISVTFSDPLSPEDQAQFRSEFQDEAEQILFCYQGGIDLEFGGTVKNVYFLASDQDLEGFVDLHSGEEDIPMPGLNEAVLTIGAAKSMGIEVGDTVTLRDSDLREMDLTISGIYDNNVYNYIIISGDTMRGQWDQSPELSTAFVVNADGQDVHELGADISGYDGVLSVTINQDNANQVNSMMDALDAVIILIVVCAGLLAGTVLYNLTNINIKERIREIATIKVLGFNSGETASYVFKENLALTVMGTLLGLAGGKLLHAVVMSYVRIDMVWFDNQINWYSYVFAALLTLLSALIVDFIMYFQLEKINMAEALKSVE